MIVVMQQKTQTAMAHCHLRLELQWFQWYHSFDVQTRLTIKGIYNNVDI